MAITLPTSGQTNWDVPLNAALTELDGDVTTINNIIDVVPGIETRVAGETWYRLVAASNATSNVKAKADYVCAGTNDQQMIQQAVDAAFAEGGGIVMLSSGSFNLSAPITLHPTVTLQGTHADQIFNPGQIVSQTYLRPQNPFSGGAAIVLLGQTAGGYTNKSAEQRIFNITIDGSVSAANVHGIQASDYIHGVVLRDVAIKQVTGKGIYTFTENAAQPFSWTFHRVMVDNSNDVGIHLINHSDCTMVDVISIGAGGNNYTLSNMPNSRLIGCRAEWSDAHGFYVTGNFGTGQGSGGLSMTGCSTDRNSFNGVYIDATGNAPITINGLMSRRDGRNNNLGGGNYAGVNVTNATAPVIIGNWTNYPGVDDNGTGVNSPQYGGSFTNVSVVQVENSYLHANTAGVFNGGSNDILKIGSNVVYATGPTTTPVRSVDPGVTSLGWFNVKDFGAIGDGLTVDTAALQAAINAANAVAGGTVYLPRGEYVIDAALTMHSHIKLMGDGDFVTEIRQTSTTANGIEGDTLIYVNLESFRLTGPGSGSGQGIKFTTEFDYCLLKDITVTDWGSTGIELFQPIVSNMTRVTSRLNGGAGFYIHGTGTGAGTSLSMDSCWAHDNVSNGYTFDNMTYCSLVACAADNQINAGTAGYNIVNSSGFSLVGCGAEANFNGLKFAGGNSHFVGGFFCYATPTTGIGIYVTGGATNIQLIAIAESTPSVSAAAWVKTDSGVSATIQGSIASTANSLAANTTVVASNSSGTRAYAGGVSVGANLAVTGTSTLTGAVTAQSTLTTTGVTQHNAQTLVNTATSPAFKVTGTAAAQQLMVASGLDAASFAQRSLVTGDAFDRYAMTVDGAMAWGSGAAARDTVLHRIGVGALQTDGAFAIGGSLTMYNNKILQLQNGTAADDAAAFGQIPTAGTGSTNYTVGNDTRVLVPYNTGAQSQGLVQWNYDSEAASSTNTLTLGTIFMGKVYLAAGQTVTGLGFTVLTAGATLTYARAALYNSAGTQVALSNDQSTNWTSTGYKVNTLSAPYVVPTAGFYWVGFLTTGTTAPVCASSNGTQTTFNANVSGATLRHGTAGTGQTSLPGSITMSSMVSTGASLWIGLN